MEEEGTTMEEAEKITGEELICENALPLMFEGGSGIWCAKTSMMCYKILGEVCEDENPVSAF